MLVIRREQLSALGNAPRRQFEDALIKHAQKYYPDECRAMEREDIRRFARQAIDASTAQGFPLEREIAYFFSLMFMLGIEFFRDPQLPWNFEGVGHTRLAERVGQMDQFFKAAMEYIDDTAGPDNENLVRAMIRIRNFDLNQVPALGPGFVAGIGKILGDLFPEKYAYQGEAVTRSIIQSGIEEAAQYGIKDNQGLFCYTALMFMEGSGMHRDPVYGWIRKVLKDPALAAGNARGQRLFQVAKEHIAESLKPLGSTR